ncbi:hypothetical protein DPEC_G00167510 [Dallia pectoralis]|uniref:Uncharacterized protein n=1 Tax=Dallia pectoralis TaxID=75939 RepID=A0ACC2GHL6_DALPE|nr:hypothetical protein DPEC_G00167510 [Dallia pectoralis]
MVKLPGWRCRCLPCSTAKNYHLPQLLPSESNESCHLPGPPYPACVSYPCLPDDSCLILKKNSVGNYSPVSPSGSTSGSTSGRGA